MVKTTVYFDGSCPLCRAEIEHYRREDDIGALAFVDVSDTVAPLPSGLTRQHAMERFHVLEGNGQLLSGAAAFVSVQRRLPRWRWAARVAALPGASTALELGYRLFLPAIAPALERFGWQGHFCTVQTADKAPSKPNPGMVHQALSEANVEAVNAIMVGDTAFDMEMACAAGVRGVAVSWGYHRPDRHWGAVRLAFRA